MSFKNIKVIIFDFDGTISDSHDAMIEVYHLISKKFGYREIDIETLRNQTSKENLKAMGISLIKLPYIAKEARTLFQGYVHTLEPIQGMKDALTNLKKAQFQIGILTSNSSENVDQFLKKNDLNIFDFVTSEASVFGKAKILKKMVKTLKLKPDQMIYVGDETRDIEAAHKAGVRVVAVSWGLNSKKSLQIQKPDWLIDRPDELMDLFKN